MLRLVTICVCVFMFCKVQRVNAFCSFKADTPIVLKTVNVSANQYQNLLGSNKQQQIDSVILLTGLNQNLATLLQTQSQIFIKNYGNGQLASVSMRGGNASHTPVLWNGFDLQSPMLGQTDLSLFPAFFLSGVNINYGSTAALFGSGAVGGTINLQTNQKIKEGFSGRLLLGYASFGINTIGLQLNFKRQNFTATQHFYTTGGQNNFSYVNNTVAGNLTENAVNANYKSISWLNQLSYKFNEKHNLSLKTWVQTNQRNLPPALGTSSMNASQCDISKRIIAEYNFLKANYHLQIRSGLFNDKIHYKSNVPEDSRSNSVVFTNYIDQFFNFKNSLFHVGFMYQKSGAELKDYVSAQQNRMAFFGSYKWFWIKQKLEQQVVLRQEFVDGKLVPFTPSYSFTYRFNQTFSILGNISKAYRLPTFNDLYWTNLGNPNLKPEEGYCQEISINTNYKLLSFTATVYNKNLNNWIIWLPNSTGLYTAQNMATVWSRGAEFNWNVKQNFGKLLFTLNGLHDYNLATNTESKSASDSSLNKQLIYTPKIKHQLNLTVNYKQFFVNVNQNYVGIRFTKTDNLDWLSPYQITNLNIGHDFKLVQKKLNLNFGLNNLFNTNYQVVLARPMPLRNYNINLILNF